MSAFAPCAAVAFPSRAVCKPVVSAMAWPWEAAANAVEAWVAAVPSPRFVRAVAAFARSDRFADLAAFPATVVVSVATPDSSAAS